MTSYHDFYCTILFLIRRKQLEVVSSRRRSDSLIWGCPMPHPPDDRPSSNATSAISSAITVTQRTHTRTHSVRAHVSYRPATGPVPRTPPPLAARVVLGALLPPPGQHGDGQKVRRPRTPHRARRLHARLRALRAVRTVCGATLSLAWAPR